MKKLLSILLALSMVLCMSVASLAHSGRTDANGGHKDNKNVSGLGSYHYHHGYGPHLHPDGICPYGTSSTSVTPASSTSAKTTTAAPATTQTPSVASPSVSASSVSSTQSPSLVTVKAGKRTPIPKFTSPAAKTDKEKAVFLDNYIAIVTNAGVYHTIDCEDFSRYEAFTAMDLAKALERDYKPCSKCHS